MIEGIAAFCKRIGVTRRRGYQLIPLGLPVLKVGKLLKVDVEKGKAWYEANYQEPLKRGPSSGADPGGDDISRERAQLRLELEHTRLEKERAGAELARLRGEIARGQFIPVAAARLLYSRLLWTLKQQIDNLPLRIIHHIAKDHETAARLDLLIRDHYARIFQLTNEHDIATENAYILKFADIIIGMAEAQITMDQCENRDPATAEAAREFAQRVRSLFLQMTPELIERLGLKFKIRGQE